MTEGSGIKIDVNCKIQNGPSLKIFGKIESLAFYMRGKACFSFEAVQSHGLYFENN